MICAVRKHLAHMGDVAAAEDLGEAKRREQQQRLVDIAAEGERAALNGLGAGLGSCYDGEEFIAFGQGFLRGAGKRASEAMKRGDVARASRICIPCDCGGTGRCRDAV